ncbi:glycosyltransferase family 9 protein [Telmatospirillum sp. J64-1]|uniref:glycosyltransferase family 9 protein n=1 Tax=Telmatospirillum sp. J64-1 TaxID=2502183 RepID=UPI0021042D3F|nr:glycosyltransferase family 9 protein [Telmatospirillum sp. J64-1]
MPAPQRILFITANRIGDAVLSTGILDHLLRLYPAARVTVACGPLVTGLFKDVPQVERVIAMPKRKRSGHWVRLWAKTAGTRWEIVVDLRSSLLSWLLWTRKRAVFSGTKEPIHKVRQLAALFDLDPPPAPRLWAGPEAAAKATALLPSQGPILAIGPTANWGGKQWRAEYFAETVARLTGPGGILPNAPVVIMGAPGEEEKARPVAEAVPPARRIDLVGKIGLDVTAAVLARCSFYLGNDSGLMHMAAASKLPTLGLFGPSDERIYGPWGEHTACLRTKRSFQEILASPEYDYRSHATMMDEIEVDQVVTAATALWRRVAQAA